jgi:hypothetical protein
MLLNVASVGMLILHRCYYLSSKNVDGRDNFEFSTTIDTQNEDQYGWNWLEYDLIWLKVAHILPNRSLAIAHLAGSLILLLSRILSNQGRFASPNFFFIKLILLIAFIATLQMEFISHLSFIIFAIIVSLFNFLSSFFILWKNRFDLNPTQDKSSKYGILLVHYSSMLFLFSEQTSLEKTQPTTEDFLFGGFFVLGFVYALTMLGIYSVYKKRWILIGGKLKEKSSFNLILQR